MNITDRLTQADIEFYYASRAPKIRQSGAKWRGPCPLHNGERDSFSIKAETGVWHCHSECGTGGDVIQFEMRFSDCDMATAIKNIETLLDIEPKDRPKPTPQQAQKPAKKFVEAYSYFDESGNLSYQVCRWEPKDFYQRRPDPYGPKKWINHLGQFKGDGYTLAAVDPIIYNLPEVIKSKYVVIVEGEKDAKAIKSLGFLATCNSGGAGKWRKEFAKWFAGKVVVVIPDIDAFDPRLKDNEQFKGQRHAIEVVRSIVGVAESVKLVELDGFHDADEFVSRGGTTESFRSLIGKAAIADDAVIAAFERRWTVGVREEIPAGTKEESKAVETFKPQDEGDDISPNDIARRVLRDRGIITDSTGGVYEYDGMTWAAISPKQIESYVIAKDTHRATSKRRRSEASDYIMTVTRTRWVPWRSIEDFEVPMRNGVVDLRSGIIRAHRQTDYLETVVPHDYDPKAKCPVWEKALSVWFSSDPDYKEKLSAIQEFFGYILMAHAKYKKALLLFGKPDSGKSQALAAAEHMVGRNNTTSISVEDMNEPRKLAPIKGKMLNCLSELRSDALIADGGFKKLISTGDPVQLDQKYKEQETYTPFAKHVIVGNIIPAVNDLTEATHNRLLIVAFNHAVPPEKRDVRLIDKLIAEMRGIIAWALHGAARLYENDGRFTVIPEALRIIEEHRRGQNPINDFLAENAIEAEGAAIRLPDLRERFSRWNGRTVLSARILTLLKSAKMDLVELDSGRTKALRGWRLR